MTSLTVLTNADSAIFELLKYPGQPVYEGFRACGYLQELEDQQLVRFLKRFVRSCDLICHLFLLVVDRSRREREELKLLKASNG